ncbi:MAG: hypothetical protein OXT09_27440 [Myxococcales bacterium]|nr:hypothetical protein [Myxococcales bacterium]
MMIRMLIVAIAVFCTFGAIGCKRTRPPETTAAVGGSEAGASAGDEDQLICRRERITGSHQTRKVCRYQRDVRRQRDDARDQVRTGGNANAPNPNE